MLPERFEGKVVVVDGVVLGELVSMSSFQPFIWCLSDDGLLQGLNCGEPKIFIRDADAMPQVGPVAQSPAPAPADKTKSFVTVFMAYFSKGNYTALAAEIWQPQDKAPSVIYDNVAIIQQDQLSAPADLLMNFIEENETSFTDVDVVINTNAKALVDVVDKSPGDNIKLSEIQNVIADSSAKNILFKAVTKQVLPPRLQAQALQALKQNAQDQAAEFNDI